MKLYKTYVEELPSVAGKEFVITGTTSGTGFVAARTAAIKGASKVYLLNRPSSRVDTSVEALKQACPDNANAFVPIPCDLQDFASVRQAAATLRTHTACIYCLANNAGLMAAPDLATTDGYDVQMQTNHLAHFLLTHALMPLLRAGAAAHGEARIVNHSSNARHMTPTKSLEAMYFERRGGDLGGNGGSWAGFSGPRFTRYHQSKLANSVFTHALHEKLAKHDPKNTIRVIACHPGIANSNLSSGSKDMQGFLFKLMGPLFRFLSQSTEDGSLGLLMGMMDPKAESDVLYGPADGKMTGPAVANTAKPYEIDPKAMSLLWSKSEEATGIEFDL